MPQWPEGQIETQWGSGGWRTAMMNVSQEDFAALVCVVKTTTVTSNTPQKARIAH